MAATMRHDRHARRRRRQRYGRTGYGSTPTYTNG